MKTKLLLLCLTAPFFLNAQIKTVEKSVWNVQASYSGLYLNNETALNDKLALRLELGLTPTYISSTSVNSAGVLFSPLINVEPRFYYNIKKRSDNGKRTAGNSADFFTISTLYNSDIFLISTISGAKRTFNDLYIIPKWGMRRVYNNFNFEAGLGAGIVTYIGEKRRINANKSSDLALDLHLRVGYKF